MQYAYKNMMWSSQFNLPDMYYVYLIALYNQIVSYLEPFSMQEPNSKRWYLTANIFESGPMLTPWKFLDRPPLLPSCKLG